MKENILYKIKEHLLKGIINEADVVYFMVEIRKIIEKEFNSKALYPLLEFYCDWTVHSEKDRITPEIESIMIRIDKELNEKDDYNIRNNGRNSENIKFIYAEELKKEFKSFLSDFGLPYDLCDDSSRWISFIQLLYKVLIDQPINFKAGNPVHNIKTFILEPAAEGAVIWVIKFFDNRRDLRFGNAF